MTTQDRPTYFPFYESFSYGTSYMTDEQLGKFIRALSKYTFEGIWELTGDPMIDGFMWMAKPNLDNAAVSYLNGKKGGRPAKTTVTSTDENTENQGLKGGFSNEETGVLTKKVKEKEKEKEK